MNRLAGTSNPAGGQRSGRAASMPPEQRRAAIIAAVRPLLLEHGEGVTVRQIAAAAGVAEGTIFGVFADKDELIAATIESAIDIGSFDQSVDEIDHNLPFEDRLLSLTELLQTRVFEAWQLLSSVGPKHRSHARGMPESKAMVDLLAVEPEHFRVEPEVAARMLRALTLALSHPMLATAPAPATEIVDMLLHGAGASALNHSQDQVAATVKQPTDKKQPASKKQPTGKKQSAAKKSTAGKKKPAANKKPAGNTPATNKQPAANKKPASNKQLAPKKKSAIDKKGDRR